MDSGNGTDPPSCPRGMTGAAVICAPFGVHGSEACSLAVRKYGLAKNEAHSSGDHVYKAQTYFLLSVAKLNLVFSFHFAKTEIEVSGMAFLPSNMNKIEKPGG